MVLVDPVSVSVTVSMITAAACLPVMTRWNAEFLKQRGLPEAPVPFSPVQRARN